MKSKYSCALASMGFLFSEPLQIMKTMDQGTLTRTVLWSHPEGFLRPGEAMGRLLQPSECLLKCLCFYTFGKHSEAIWPPWASE